MCLVKRINWACGCPQGVMVVNGCPDRDTPACRRRHLLDRMRITIACREHRAFTTLARRGRRTPTRVRIGGGFLLSFRPDRIPSRNQRRVVSPAASAGSSGSSVVYLGSRPVQRMDPMQITAESIFDPGPPSPVHNNYMTADGVFTSGAALGGNGSAPRGGATYDTPMGDMFATTNGSSPNTSFATPSTVRTGVTGSSPATANTSFATANSNSPATNGARHGAGGSPSRNRRGGNRA